MKDAKIMSTSWLTANARSFLSFSERAGRSTSTQMARPPQFSLEISEDGDVDWGIVWPLSSTVPSMR